MAASGDRGRRMVSCARNVKRKLLTFVTIHTVVYCIHTLERNALPQRAAQVFMVPGPSLPLRWRESSSPDRLVGLSGRLQNETPAYDSPQPRGFVAGQGGIGYSQSRRCATPV